MKKGYYLNLTNGCMKPQTIFCTATPRRCSHKPVENGTRLHIRFHGKKSHSYYLKMSRE